MRARAGIGALLVVLVLGYGTADALDVVPGVLTTSAVPGPVPTRPTPVDPSARPAAPALAALSVRSPVPSPAGVARTLAPLIGSAALGAAVSARVVDPASGQVLLDRLGAVPRVPASTTKLLTGAAALSVLGAQTTLTTRVVAGVTPDEVVLVGGGDQLLSPGASDPRAVAGRAGLATLAGQVTARLRAQGRSTVAVRFDDSVFTGPDVAPTWAPADVAFGYTGRVSGLGLVGDRARPGRPSPADPSASAARAFATALQQAGTHVIGSPARTRAVAGAAVLGQVSSASVADVLDLALTESDNALAEGLAHLTARQMGRATTFVDSARAVLDAVQALGVDTGADQLLDASGLSRGDRVSAASLTSVLTLAAGDHHPELRPLLVGLPISGLTGTLADRYRGPLHPVAGTVRAKTGTLTGVSSLAGTTVDADGRLLVFAVLADAVPSTEPARVQLDRVAAALTGCGCR